MGCQPLELQNSGFCRCTCSAAASWMHPCERPSRSDKSLASSQLAWSGKMHLWRIQDHFLGHHKVYNFEELCLVSVEIDWQVVANMAGREHNDVEMGNIILLVEDVRLYRQHGSNDGRQAGHNSWRDPCHASGSDNSSRFAIDEADLYRIVDIQYVWKPIQLS